MVINTFKSITKDCIMEQTCIAFLGNRKDGTFTKVEVQSVKILLEDVKILDIIDLSVHNCIVSRQTHVSWDFLFDVIYIKEKQCWAKDRALGNS